MTSRLPFPLPGPYSPGALHRNPAVTNPLPFPGDIPSPCWFGGGISLVWNSVVGSVADTQLQATWASPIFDMRPDLRGISPNNAGGFTNTAGPRSIMSGVPMWNPAASLWIQLENPRLVNGLLGVNLAGLKVIATEEVHICNPQNIATISDPADITEEFSTLGRSSILSWYPAGDGNPARYYRLTLTFNVLQNWQAPEPTVGPEITLQAAMY